MRIKTLVIVALGSVLAGATAHAQTYDPAYPVCLHVMNRISYFECGYTSLAQCNATASGRAAQCVINPYYAGAEIGRPPLRHRRYHKAAN